jgi:hypothetical protein
VCDGLSEGLQGPIRRTSSCGAGEAIIKQALVLNSLAVAASHGMIPDRLQHDVVFDKRCLVLDITTGRLQSQTNGLVVCKIRSLNGAVEGDNKDRAGVVRSAKIEDMLLSSAGQDQEKNTNL